jgi:hypothetical protein
VAPNSLRDPRAHGTLVRGHPITSKVTPGFADQGRQCPPIDDSFIFMKDYFSDSGATGSARYPWAFAMIATGLPTGRAKSPLHYPSASASEKTILSSSLNNYSL